MNRNLVRLILVAWAALVTFAYIFAKEVDDRDRRKGFQR